MTAAAAAELVAGCMREQAIIPDAVKAGGLAFYPQTAGGTALHHAAALGNPDVLEAVIEAARNVAGVPTAGSEEFDHESGKKRFEPVVYHLKEWVQGNHKVARSAPDDKGGTMRLGAYDAILKEGSKVAEIYGDITIDERHRHRYEVDVKYRAALEEKGLIFSGMSPDDRLPEIIEWADHPWFIGVQFHPELKSKPFDPHPLFKDFVRAAKDISRLV